MDRRRAIAYRAATLRARLASRRPDSRGENPASRFSAVERVGQRSPGRDSRRSRSGELEGRVEGERLAELADRALAAIEPGGRLPATTWQRARVKFAFASGVPDSMNRAQLSARRARPRIGALSRAFAASSWAARSSTSAAPRSLRQAKSRAAQHEIRIREVVDLRQIDHRRAAAAAI
jgi:hypothetical protein